jgi:NAD(P)-dependent dehydrogenase (short-subunit alcohol dehydrogenase family)
VIAVDLRDSTVVVTGGTRGLGRAIGIELARAGASVVLTHRWDSVPAGEVQEAFAALSLPAPEVVESDVSDPAATRALMRSLRGRAPLRAIVSNVAFAKIVRELSDLKRNALDLSLAYSAWPIVDLVQAAQEELGALPRYVVGVSSDGAEVCHPGYDLAGASKAVLETLCRYLAVRLRAQGVRVNALRPGLLDTQSSRAMLGDEALERLARRVPSPVLDLTGIARACVALCSGLLDSMTGQVLVVDEGWSLVDPLEWITGPPDGAR